MLEEKKFDVAEASEILWKEDVKPKLFGQFNKAVVAGKLEPEIRYSYTRNNKMFYCTAIRSRRISGTYDVIPVIISNEILEQRDIYALKGKTVELDGEFWSSNRNGHLNLFLFVKGIEICEDEIEFIKNTNIIYLNWYVCKPSVYRLTPLGKSITDLIIAVNKSDGRNDYIPCITWKKTAEAASNLKVSDRIELYGRIQSREYSKKIYFEDGYSEEKHMINEISVIRLQKIY